MRKERFSKECQDLQRLVAFVVQELRHCVGRTFNGDESELVLIQGMCLQDNVFGTLDIETEVIHPGWSLQSLQNLQQWDRQPRLDVRHGCRPGLFVVELFSHDASRGILKGEFDWFAVVSHHGTDNVTLAMAQTRPILGIALDANPLPPLLRFQSISVGTVNVVVGGNVDKVPVRFAVQQVKEELILVRLRVSNVAIEGNGFWQGTDGFQMFARPVKGVNQRPPLRLVVPVVAGVIFGFRRLTR